MAGSGSVSAVCELSVIGVGNVSLMRSDEVFKAEPVSLWHGSDALDSVIKMIAIHCL